MQIISRTIFLITAFFLLWPIAAVAQLKVTGSVRESGGGPAAGVNVLVKAQGKILGYSITGSDGLYSVSYDTQADSIAVSVTGFNIESQEKLVTRGTAKVDFTVKYAKQKIREVTIQAEPVKRQGDTLTYYVEKFRSETDRSIGDILEKLPGIEVSKSGLVKYNGKAINKFYIEGLDMLEGRYGLATRNVQAKDVASVEVYENHQPIKMLQDINDSDQAAINLKLKDSAKGTWNSVFQLGAGISPLLWNAEMAPMYFAKDFQLMATYKTNNTGDDVSDELASHYDTMGGTETPLSVTEPAEPPVGENRHLFNNIHAASLSALKKTGENSTLNGTAVYVHDRQEAEGLSETEYYLGDGSSVTIPENTETTHVKNSLGVDLKYLLNSSKAYLSEKISFEGSKLSDHGNVETSGENVSQSMTQPQIKLRNSLSTMKMLKRWRLNLFSNTTFEDRSSTLEVLPTPYPEIFGSATGYDNAYQSFDYRRFVTENSLGTSIQIRKWHVSLMASLNAESGKFGSSLSAMDGEGRLQDAPDSMRNDMNWTRLEGALSPNVILNQRNITVTLGLPVSLSRYSRNDGLHGLDLGETLALFNPYLSVNGKLSYSCKYNLAASMGESAGSLGSGYGGYVMSGYRNIGSRESGLVRSSSQNVSGSISYGDAIRAIFFNLGARYYHSVRNVTYGTEYIGTLSRTTAYLMDNETSMLSASGSVSKRIDAISTTIGIDGGWNRYWYETVLQGNMVPYILDYFNAGANLSTRFGKSVLLDYDMDYNVTKSRINGAGLSPISTVRQELDLSYVINRRLSMTAHGEHYFNASVEGDDRNIFFADLSVSYKAKRMEYILEGRNLLNSTTFSEARLGGTSSFVYTTKLRPVSVMLKIRFTLR